PAREAKQVSKRSLLEDGGGGSEWQGRGVYRKDHGGGGEGHGRAPYGGLSLSQVLGALAVCCAIGYRACASCPARAARAKSYESRGGEQAAAGSQPAVAAGEGRRETAGASEHQRRDRGLIHQVYVLSSPPLAR